MQLFNHSSIINDKLLIVVDFSLLVVFIIWTIIRGSCDKGIIWLVWSRWQIVQPGQEMHDYNQCESSRHETGMKIHASGYNLIIFFWFYLNDNEYREGKVFVSNSRVLYVMPLYSAQHLNQFGPYSFLWCYLCLFALCFIV